MSYIRNVLSLSVGIGHLIPDFLRWGKSNNGMWIAQGLLDSLKQCLKDAEVWSPGGSFKLKIKIAYFATSRLQPQYDVHREET